MAENTAIEWAHHTFNPWVGCTKISPACDNCYAESWAKRAGEPELWNGERRRTSEANWQTPRKWDRACASAGIRQRVFCASLADVFDNQAEQIWRDWLWALIAITPNLDWMLLTKRPQNVAKMVPDAWMNGAWPANVWLGITAEDQTRLEQRARHLVQIPADITFISGEPLLGPLNLRCVRIDDHTWLDLLTGVFRRSMDFEGYLGEVSEGSAKGNDFGPLPPRVKPLDWAIVGGESGPRARGPHPRYVRQLRDQCAETLTYFMFKQWGEWKPFEDITAAEVQRNLARGFFRDGTAMIRAGKKHAGRLIDGVLHDQVPPC